MILKNSLSYINQFFFLISNQARKFYLNSKIYNNKISKINEKNLEYKPSPNLLECLIKYDKNKNNIEDFYQNKIWLNENCDKLESCEPQVITIQRCLGVLLGISGELSGGGSVSIAEMWREPAIKYLKSVGETV